MAPMTRKVTSFRGLFGLNKSKRINGESVLKDVEVKMTLPTSMNALDVTTTNSTIDSISAAPIGIECKEINSEGKSLAKLASFLNATDSIQVLSLDKSSSSDTHDEDINNELDISECLNKNLSPESDKTDRVLVVDVREETTAEILMRTTADDCRSVSDHAKAETIQKKEADELGFKLSESDRRLRVGSSASRGRTSSNPETPVLRRSRFRVTPAGQRRASIIHSHISSHNKLTSPGSSRVMIRSVSEINLQSTSWKVDGLTLARAADVPIPIARRQISTDSDCNGSVRSWYSDPEDQQSQGQRCHASKFESSQPIQLQVDNIESWATVSIPMDSLGKPQPTKQPISAGPEYAATKPRAVSMYQRQASTSSESSGQDQTRREFGQSGLNRRATSMRVKGDKTGLSKNRVITSIPAQRTDNSRTLAAITGYKRQNSMPVSDSALTSSFCRVHEKPSLIESKIAARRAARQNMIAKQIGEVDTRSNTPVAYKNAPILPPMHSLTRTSASSPSSTSSENDQCGSQNVGKLQRRNSLTRRASREAGKQLSRAHSHSPTNGTPVNHRPTYVSQTSVPSMSIVTPEAVLARKNRKEPVWVTSQKEAKPRVLLNEAVTVHAAYTTNEYDRTPFRASPLSRAEFRELMAYKLDEMVVHSSSYGNVNHHVMKVRLTPPCQVKNRKLMQIAE